MKRMGNWAFNVVREVSDTHAIVAQCQIRIGRRVTVVTAPANVRIHRDEVKPALMVHELAGKFVIYGNGEPCKVHRFKAEPDQPSWAVNMPVEELVASNESANLAEAGGL